MGNIVNLLCYSLSVFVSQVEMERIARQNLEAELQRTLDKLSHATASSAILQQEKLVYCM